MERRSSPERREQQDQAKRRYVYGVELVECKCGVWRADVSGLGCWNHGAPRSQLMVEAIAQFNQALRNLGYEILRAFKGSDAR